ncbi:hypothetical protein CEQ90_19440 [Lewinellaceae bacterium SD302]|nr:hypothetical protein CEQ90_19440 [Lewinellaceae bacterium SD302]
MADTSRIREADNSLKFSILRVEHQSTQLPNEDLDWALISVAGRIIKQGKLPRGHGGQLIVESDNLPAGLYRLNVNTATLLTTKNLIKQD